MFFEFIQRSFFPSFFQCFFFLLFLLSFLFIAWAFIASAKCNQQSLAHSIFSALSRSIIYLKCLEAYNALTRMDVQIYLCRLFLFSLSWLFFSHSLSLSFAWFTFEFRTIINMKFILLKYIKHNKWQLFILLCEPCIHIQSEPSTQPLVFSSCQTNLFFFLQRFGPFYWFSVVSCVCMTVFSKMVYFKSLVVIASNCIEGSFYFILTHFK